MVAKLFGVKPNRVHEWIKYKYLKSRRYKDVSGMFYHVIDGNDLIRFLHVRGGIMAFEPTTDEWRRQKERGRQHILATTLTTQEVAELLNIETGHLPFLKRERGFPRPCIIQQGCKGTNRYRKIDVLEWLRGHPQYDLHGTRRERLCT